MNNIPSILGRYLYFVLCPALMIYLHRSTRTRVALRCKNKILLVRPWLSNGKWDLPGGGVHRGEEIAAGALRELYEETHITLSVRKLKRVKEIYPARLGLVRYDIIAFTAMLDKQPELKLQKFEIAEAQWISRPKMAKLQLADGVEQAVARCFKT
jgi:8-oxo-dGTP pyrophosphatase MutT (NUDIX family)